ncbi:MAG: type II secretion system protein [Phycisphaerae bacterium]
MAWPRGPRPAALSAFTLPEVLATMMLMGIVLPVVMSGVSTALSAAERARNTAQAATLGEAKLAELVATGQWGLTAGGGDFSPDFPQYRWVCQTATRDFGAVEIILQVSWIERGMERSLLLSTIAYENQELTGILQ